MLCCLFFVVIWVLAFVCGLFNNVVVYTCFDSFTCDLALGFGCDWLSYGLVCSGLVLICWLVLRFVFVCLIRQVCGSWFVLTIDSTISCLWCLLVCYCGFAIPLDVCCFVTYAGCAVVSCGYGFGVWVICVGLIVLIFIALISALVWNCGYIVWILVRLFTCLFRLCVAVLFVLFCWLVGFVLVGLLVCVCIVLVVVFVWLFFTFLLGFVFDIVFYLVVLVYCYFTVVCVWFTGCLGDYACGCFYVALPFVVCLFIYLFLFTLDFGLCLLLVWVGDLLLILFGG